MIESLASTCLGHICSDSNGSIYCNNSTTKASILRFGISCVSAPCSDGSASTITGIVRQTASYMRFDRDYSVSSMAFTALNICDSMVTFRAPPLVIVKRDKNIDAFSDGMNVLFSKATIEEGIYNSREIMLQRKRETKQKSNENLTKIIGNPVQNAIESLKLDKGEKKEKILTTEESNQENDDAEKLEVETSKPQEFKSSEERSTKKDTTPLPEYKANEASLIDQMNETKTSENTMIDDEGDDSDEDDFPMIVDCDPDDEDMI